MYFYYSSDEVSYIRLYNPPDEASCCTSVFGTLWSWEVLLPLELVYTGKVEDILWSC